MDINPTDPELIGSRLREERRRLGLTQVELAKLGGVRRVSLYLYEKGDRLVPLDFMLRVRQVGVSLSYVLWGDRLPEQRLKRQVDTELCKELFRLVDQYAVDAKGRPLHPAYRASLFDELMDMTTNLEKEEVDRVELQRKLESFAA